VSKVKNISWCRNLLCRLPSNQAYYRISQVER
jgi:hypothetical protein